MRRRWKALVAVGICAALVYPMFSYVRFASGWESHDLASDVPIGSRLSELDRYFRWPNWDPDNFNGEVGAEPGSPTQYSGDYESWTATPEERDRFSGQITFYHHGSTSSDVNQLEYKNGRLVHKDWGFLPG